MEWTRGLESEDKAKLLKYCERLIEQTFSDGSFELNKYKKKDLLRIENLTQLKFNSEGVEQLKKWYMTKNENME